MTGEGGEVAHGWQRRAPREELACGVALRTARVPDIGVLERHDPLSLLQRKPRVDDGMEEAEPADTDGHSHRHPNDGDDGEAGYLASIRAPSFTSSQERPS